jgi:hypothetical protein
LGQLFNDRPEAIVRCSIEELAEEICDLTQGHRGLTGVCLDEVDKLIASGEAITMDVWLQQARTLPYLLSSQGYSTYFRLMIDVSSLLRYKEVADIIMELLYNGGKWSIMLALWVVPEPLHQHASTTCMAAP